MPEQMMTKHVAQRIAQRGVRTEALNVVLAYGEDVPACNGCLKRELRHAQAVHLIADGLPLEVVETALKIEAIVSRDERLVTCYMRAPQCIKRSSIRVRKQIRYGRRV
jgi:site-specific recombinase XerD